MKQKLFIIAFIISLLSMAKLHGQNNNTMFVVDVLKTDNANKINLKITSHDNNAPFYYVLRDTLSINGSTVLDYSKKTRKETYLFENLLPKSYCVCVTNNNSQTTCVTIDTRKTLPSQMK